MRYAGICQPDAKVEPASSGGPGSTEHHARDLKLHACFLDLSQNYDLILRGTDNDITSINGLCVAVRDCLRVVPNGLLWCGVPCSRFRASINPETCMTDFFVSALSGSVYMWKAKLGLAGCFQYWPVVGHCWQSPGLRDYSKPHSGTLVFAGRHCPGPEGPLGSASYIIQVGRCIYFHRAIVTCSHIVSIQGRTTWEFSIVAISSGSPCLVPSRTSPQAAQDSDFSSMQYHLG